MPNIYQVLWVQSQVQPINKMNHPVKAQKCRSFIHTESLLGGTRRVCKLFIYPCKDWLSSVREDFSFYQLHTALEDTVEAVREEETPAEPSRGDRHQSPITLTEKHIETLVE